MNVGDLHWIKEDEPVHIKKVIIMKPPREDSDEQVSILEAKGGGGGGGGGGYSHFSSYVGSGPASSVHPKKISGISSTPKKYLKF